VYINPYAPLAGQGVWLKANFHVHAVPDGQGGQWTPKQLERQRLSRPAWPGAPARGPLNDVSKVIALYKDAGYDVLTIADQSSVMDTREIGDRLGILTIKGIENIEQDGILCIDIRRFIRGQPQEVIDECAEQGGFSIICHPNLLPAPGFPPLLARETTKSLKGYDGVEIMTPAVFKGLQGSGLATDFWDELLGAGRLVWGFGNDDFHWHWEMDRAWNWVFAGERTVAGVMAALKRGSTYVSTGLVLKEFSFQDGVLSVAATLPGGRPQRLRYELVGEGGAILAEASGESARYRLSGSEAYVRVQAASGDGSMLWTQPLYDDQRLRKM
jgi:hypothetical protein